MIPNAMLQDWETMAATLVKHMGIDAAVICQVEGDYLEVMISCNGHATPIFPGDSFISVAEWNALQRSHVDIASFPSATLTAQEAQHVNSAMNTAVGVPVVLPDGSLFGSLFVLDREQKEFSNDDLREMESLGQSMERSLASIYYKTLANALITNMPLAALVLSRDGTLFAANNVMRTYWGISEHALEGAEDVLAVLSEEVENSAAFSEGVAHLLQHPMLQEAGSEVLLKNGKVLESHSAGLIDETGNPWGRIWFFYDTSGAKSLEQRLRILATTDAQTGVPNKRHLVELAGREINRARRYQTPLTMIVVGVSLVEDSFDVSVNDELMRSAALIINSLLRDADIMGRATDGTFAVLLSNTGVEGAKDCAGRIREAMHSLCQSQVEGDCVDVSIGIAEYAGAEMDYHLLYELAETAMLRSIRMKTGSIQVYCS